MKTPKFWHKKTILSLILLPLSGIYWLGFKLFWAFRQENDFEIKVMCIGNLTSGGAGKTPVGIAIGEILKDKGVNFAYLSSGYKGENVDFCEVKESSDASEVGDEPILLSEIAPTFVSKDRVDGVQKIQDLGYDLVILDDGMQNNSVKKDLLYIVVDGKIKFGNGFLFPAGPLRQGIKSGLRMADKIIVVGGLDEYLVKKFSRCGVLNKMIAAKINAVDIDRFKDKKIFAFCGLGYPEKFFSFLDENGVNVVKKQPFADHYSYKNSDLDLLIKKSEEKKAILLTTKKDWVKFDKKYREKIDFLEIDFTFKEENVIIEDVNKVIAKQND